MDMSRLAVFSKTGNTPCPVGGNLSDRDG